MGFLKKTNVCEVSGVDAYAQTLSKMIQLETVSEFNQKDKKKFRDFHSLLKKLFPKLFKACTVKDFDGSLLLKWNGKQNSKQLPYLFMNHMDVVEATGNWNYPPFSGTIKDNVIHGRGAIDTKGGLFCMMQAAEELIEKGFVPERDIYFESACTEEVGSEGAQEISRYLKDTGIMFDLVLDEGGFILYDPIGGADGDFALIGVEEKGCADLKFIAKSNGGHASVPGKNTPLVRLAKLMLDIENHEIFDVALNDTVKEMFRRFSRSMKGPLKATLGNPELFSGALKTLLPKFSTNAGAMLKSTLAFTMAKGSEGTNVMPQEAWVVGNLRSSNHQGFASSLEAIRKIAEKYEVSVEVLDPGIESGVSSYESEQFKLIENAVHKVFPDTTTTPFILTGATDARFFSKVCKNCFRFLPFKISDEQLKGIHGLNESLNIDQLPKAVEFYKTIMTN